jgi:hypothetical protein
VEDVGKIKELLLGAPPELCIAHYILLPEWVENLCQLDAQDPADLMGILMHSAESLLTDVEESGIAFRIMRLLCTRDVEWNITPMGDKYNDVHECPRAHGRAGTVKSNGSNTTSVVPSRYGLFSGYTTSPCEVSDRRSIDSAGRVM